MAFSAPEPISDRHVLEDFDCGKQGLNNWLKSHAFSNHQKGFTAVMVVHENMQVIGYYGLAPTSIAPASLTRKVRTGQHPDPIPCLLLGQLAVDKKYIGKGIGSGLLKHALKACLNAAKLVGGRALIVKAIDEEAAAFWRKQGFLPTSDDPMQLFRSMAHVAVSVGY